MNGYIQLLRINPGYLRLWLAQCVSLLGDWFTMIALSRLVILYSGGSALAVSGLLLARFVPPVFVGPLAGVFIDRLNRKHLLIFSDLARAITVILFLIAATPDRLWLIYLLTAVQFSLSALFEPCRSALLPSLVQADDLVLANTLGSVTWSVMLSFGAIVGGAVTALVGTQAALLIDSSSFVLSALLIMSIRGQADGQQSATEHAKNGSHWLSGLVEGLRYVRARPATAAALLIKAGGSIGSVDLLVVIYATYIVGGNASGSLGVLYSAFGIGAVLGPLFLNRFNDHSVKRMRQLIVIGYLWIVVGWVLFGAATALIPVALALIVKAMGSSIYWTYSSVILQKTVPDDFLGRVFSLDWLGFYLASNVSSVLTGFAVDQVARAHGPMLNDWLTILQTGVVSVQPLIVDVRLIVFGTALISLLPLVLWTLGLAWMERADSLHPA